MSFGRRKRSIAAWKRKWTLVTGRHGAMSIDTKHLTKMRAVFRDEIAAEDVIEPLMSAGFAVLHYGDREVRGFPDVIQDEMTGEPTNLAALDK